jgi:hypothetical protein
MPATSAQPNCTPPRKAARMTTRPIVVSLAVGAGHARDPSGQSNCTASHKATICRTPNPLRAAQETTGSSKLTTPATASIRARTPTGMALFSGT